MIDHLRNSLTLCAAFALVFVSVGIVGAQPEQDWVRTETREDCLDYTAVRRAYFGETHVHTRRSFDAGLFQVITEPRDAYAFATGAVQGLPPYDAMDNPFRTYQINRPLDFTMVADHAEGFGEVFICADDSYAGYYSDQCTDARAFIALPPAGPDGGTPAIFLETIAPFAGPDPERNPDICGATNADCLAAATLVWVDTQDAAEEFYDRSDTCTFSTFIGYEFSSNQFGDNLHRNVLFRNDNVPAIPFTAFESQNPEDLWDTLDTECIDAGTGCDVITIAHNSNMSKGRMYATTLYDDISPMTQAYAEQRARLEPLAEMFQIKGNSECKFGAGSNDEECKFDSMGRSQLFSSYNPNQVFAPLSFVREALKEGFVLKEAIGVNPFEIGFIGGTDGHSSLPGAVNEEDYAVHGSIGGTTMQTEWALQNVGAGSGIDSNPGGLAVVYAEENSRDALFSAMRRRETYATSGPRINVRMFGGRMPKDLCDDPGLITEGYNRGVPMGGEIGTVKGSKSPSFVVTATKDPGGGGDPSVQLQRIEIIKAWVDSDGVRRELVSHVAGDKKKQSDASVDTSTCTPTGTGYDSLCSVWSDPKFDATEDASYYARVIENPSCRWHQYTCNAAAIDCSDILSVPTEYLPCCNEGDAWDATKQERAWSSPIFYIPENTGMKKAQVKYGKNGGDDTLKILATVGRLDADFDISVNDLTLVLRDDDEIFNVTIPAGTFVPVGNGSKFKYKDKTGSLGGVRTALFKTSTKKANQLKINTIAMDLSAADQSNHKVEFEVSIGSYQSLDETQWVYDGKRLSVPK
jgi:hypothetical protein